MIRIVKCLRPHLLRILKGSNVELVIRTRMVIGSAFLAEIPAVFAIGCHINQKKL